ncbi:MAG TPA: hypothetical protein VF116_01935 [Ktedonobacterales bacterium]
MVRREMLRRVELGAGISGAVLVLVGLVVLLLAPFQACRVTVPANGSCPAADLYTTTLLRLNLPAGFWVYLAIVAGTLLVGAAGAIVEARLGRPRAALALWAGTILGFMACAFTAGGTGIFFLPAVLANGLAAYASLLRRMRARRAAAASDEGASA